VLVVALRPDPTETRANGGVGVAVSDRQIHKKKPVNMEGAALVTVVSGGGDPARASVQSRVSPAFFPRLRRSVFDAARRDGDGGAFAAAAALVVVVGRGAVKSQTRPPLSSGSGVYSTETGGGGESRMEAFRGFIPHPLVRKKEGDEKEEEEQVEEDWR
jgi:hypothetical protein